LRRAAASIERLTASISSRRIASSISISVTDEPSFGRRGSGSTLYGEALFTGGDVFFSTDDGANVRVPVRYVAWGDDGACHTTLGADVMKAVMEAVSFVSLLAIARHLLGPAQTAGLVPAWKLTVTLHTDVTLGHSELFRTFMFPVALNPPGTLLINGCACGSK
jgi:hypothetical protein